MGAWAAVLQGVMSVDSSIQGGIEQKKQSDQNIALANEAAADASRRGGVAAGVARTGASRLAAAQRVAYSTSGVDATTGTAADVQTETSARGELDALTIENNAAREAWGFKSHGMAFAKQAGLDSSRTNREIAGGIIGTIGAGVNVADSYRGKGS